MKFWMHGIFGSVLAGALWAGMWQLVLTMVLIVTADPAVTSDGTGCADRCRRRHHGDGDAPRCGDAASSCRHDPDRVDAVRVSLGTPFDPQGLVATWQSGLFLVMNSVVIWLSISATVGDTLRKGCPAIWRRFSTFACCGDRG